MEFVTVLFLIFACICLTKGDNNIPNSINNYENRNNEINSLLAMLYKERQLQSPESSDTYSMDMGNNENLRQEYSSPTVNKQASISFSGNKAFSAGGILQPHVEILRLVESFLKFKGEMASRITALFRDNWELIQSVFRVIVSKLGGLHTFTVAGVVVLRKILEFALQLFGQWQISVPEVNFGFSGGY